MRCRHCRHRYRYSQNESP
ncbi:hypothetical protein D039_1331A, partial [Vibrio parahaemolyticus EKP-028]